MTETLPVVAFYDMPQSEQLQLFMEINENQKAVSKNLRLTLDADTKWGSQSLRERMDSVKKRLALDLGEDTSSPLYGRVQVGEDAGTELRFIKLNSIVTPLNQGSLIGDYTKDEMKKDGHFYLSNNEKSLERGRVCLFSYIELIASILSHEWKRPAGGDGILLTNKGIHALIRLYGDLLDHLSAYHKTNTKTVKEIDINLLITPYLSALKNYISNLDPSERAVIRDERGQTAPSHLWMRFQKAIRDSYPDFDPDGLTEYLELQSRKYNQQSYDQLSEIERTLNEKIGELLENTYGKTWQQIGIPDSVYDSAWKEKGKKEREYAQKGIIDTVDLWHDCLYLINYKDILGHKSNWSTIFQKSFSIPKHSNLNKDKTLSWLQELNGIRKKVMHPNSQKIQAVTQEEAQLVFAVHSWLIEDEPIPISEWYSQRLNENLDQD